MPAQVHVHITQVKRVHRLGRVGGDGALDQLHPRAAVTELMRNQARQVQRIRVRWVALQNLAIQGLRLRELPLLMQFYGLLQGGRL